MYQTHHFITSANIANFRSLPICYCTITYLMLSCVTGGRGRCCPYKPFTAPVFETGELSNCSALPWRRRWGTIPHAFYSTRVPGGRATKLLNSSIGGRRRCCPDQTFARLQLSRLAQLTDIWLSSIKIFENYNPGSVVTFQ